MKIVIFGLTMSSSWGNGHATLWRGLCRALAACGHDIVFFEKDVPYYAANRDAREFPYAKLVLYPSFDEVRSSAERHLAESDVALVTSFCPDGIAATAAVLASNAGTRVFYDLDTPVTLSERRAGRALSYVGPNGFEGFDLVLSFTGGAALSALSLELRAARVEPLFGHVDPEVHRPVEPHPGFAGALSYLGTHSADRQQALHELFIEPARSAFDHRFVLGGASYPADIPWPANVALFPHVAPPQHPAFFCSSRLTLSITRSTMARLGYCPSGRLFEAAACGVPVMSDTWEGIETFFEPGKEILLVRSGGDVLDALERSDGELARIARAGRDRVLSEHTSAHRAAEFERKVSLPPPPRISGRAMAHAGHLGAS